MLSKIFKKIIYFLISLIEKIEYRKLPLNDKILNSIDVDLMVKSDTGYVHANSIHITKPFSVYTIYLENGYYLECADDHIIFCKNFVEVFTKNLKTGDEIITNTGLSKVIKIDKNPTKLSMFDLSITNDNHRFYTNNILSHNTINAAITILHYVLFNNDKNVMIVANLGATVVEIVDKLKSIYVYLPFFLKGGVKVWNQKQISFENGCKIKTAARSKTPALGFSIDFLFLDEFAHIPTNIIEDYYQAVYPVISAQSNSRLIITSTPNGLNLFHRLYTASCLPESDPEYNFFKSMKIYWHQVEGRNVTYFRLRKDRLAEYDITKKEILEQAKKAFPFGDCVLKFDTKSKKDAIYVSNTHHDINDVKKFVFIKNEKEYNIQELAYISSWKEDAIKEMGSEEGFNQEYDLRFISGSRSILNESVMDELINSKKEYIHYPSFEFDRRLRFNYNDLKFVNDLSIFNPLDRNKIKGIYSLDIAAGVDRDYSVINIFKIIPKPPEIIEIYKKEFVYLSDFFCLQQFGMYRCNYHSVEQLAEIFYVLAFEYFNPDNFKAVVELNEYGRTFLGALPYLYEGNNQYGSSIFFNYKHRVDSLEEKVGIMVGNNKEVLVKDYQTNMNKRNWIINNAVNIDEITKFVKQTSNMGNITFAADSGNDDSVMSVVNASSVFNKPSFRELVENYAYEFVDKNTLKYFKDILANREYANSVADYDAVLNNKRYSNNYNNLGANKRNLQF